jgi:hypothetical protein
MQGFATIVEAVHQKLNPLCNMREIPKHIRKGFFIKIQGLSI